MIIIQADLYDRAKAVFDASTLELTPVAYGNEKTMLDLAKAKGVRVFIIGAEKYSDDFYKSIDASSLIVRFGVGYNAVPIALCKERGTRVAFTPGTLDASVAEHTMALILACARHVAKKHAEMRENTWAFETGMELADKTIAVIGFGNIGRRVASIARNGFGMRIHAFDRMSALAPEHAPLADAYFSSWEEAVSEAHIVSLHLAVTDTTKKFLDSKRIDAMRSDAILINTGRGALVNEADLYDALAAKRIASAGIDVFTEEPYAPVPGKDFRTLSNIVLTPHLGSNTDAANRRMAEACVKSAKAFISADMGGVTLIPEMK
ncbi:MAG: NAD(P)-dependent oxidoreductase [Spirochaetota bacterium]